LAADGSYWEALYAFGTRDVDLDHRRLRAGHAAALPDFFNSDHGASAFADRSDDKGPEPEGVTLGKAYDVSGPAAPQFATYVKQPRLFGLR